MSELHQNIEKTQLQPWLTHAIKTYVIFNYIFS
ncbi:hypothetical protein SVI_3712 [Shewanella violacea DSS12]|uniref:Uncharacterized protein n=1 Tax=Shewanella violacea (strain JCM 10179 / CIP 106290 / LMG 19151 / DSS12) TaxID=637905 RepID=D4ZCD8_SHEVD|nr:hypothetical protein SVI_3712 [Shewanella violacea DSS12]